MGYFTITVKKIISFQYNTFKFLELNTNIEKWSKRLCSQGQLFSSLYTVHAKQSNSSLQVQSILLISLHCGQAFSR